MIRLALALLCGLLGALPLRAQETAPSVRLNFGVDTADADVGPIVRLVRAYLAKPDSTAAARGLWSTRHPIDARAGDLARGYAYQGFPTTVLGVTPAARGDSVYVVKLLHARGDSTGRVYTLGMQRLLALRAPGSPHGWQLANPLPLLTRDWKRLRSGRVTFHYAPGQTPSPARAARTARFVDSLAALVRLPAPPAIDYLVTASPDEYFRAIGMDFFVLPSGRGTATGGNAIMHANIVLAGDPAQAEEYRHEVAHLVLRDHFGGGLILGEGIATWLAGSRGRPREVLFARLAEYQRARPDVTLAGLIAGELPGGWTNAEGDALYASAALFVDAIVRRGGIDALLRLRGTPSDPPALLRAMRLALELPEDDQSALERWWRTASGR
jgi:hypothetical protein